MKARSEIKAEAKKILSANYGSILGEMLLVGILTSLSSFVVVGPIIVGPPLTVGFYEGIRMLWEGKKKDRMFTGFEEGKFGRSIGSMILMAIFIWLWSMLLIIPGIIKSFSYCLTPFIVADSKDISATDAITLSKKMTQGYKGELFVFVLSYIGWGLLSGLTFGLLGIFYVGPYMMTAFGGYYVELKKKALADGVVTMADFGYSEIEE
jgi:uncharacterized membrane protein